MLATDSDEGIGGNDIFNRQKRFGEHFLLARCEVYMRVVDFALEIENFIGKQSCVSPQYERVSEAIISF
jgi:hypothetical protein